MNIVKSAPSSTPGPEGWVDLHRVANHLNISYQTAAKRVKEGKIVGHPMRNGSKTYWRFKLSEVDAAMADLAAMPPKGVSDTGPPAQRSA
jgi:hypothetical protein